MRKIITISFLYLCVYTAFSQNFNFIYIQLDYEMDYSLVKQKLNYLINNELEKQDFVLLYANSNPIRIIEQNQFSDSEISSQISSNQNYAVQMADIKNIFLRIISDKEICQISNEKLILTNRYKKINFYCFVGNDFFENGFQDSVFANFLFSSDLQHEKAINFYYYNTSGLTLETIQFGNFYNDNSINLELK